MTIAPDMAPLLDELQTVEENCLYTAQAHFAIAARKGAIVRIVYVSASVVAGLAGGLVAAGLPAWLGVFSAAGGIVGAVTAALGADKDVHVHRVAANALTKLRHEARALRETFASALTKDELSREVRRITDGYNNLIQGLPPTDDEAMAQARKAIQSGTFVPDFRAGHTGKTLPSSPAAALPLSAAPSQSSKGGGAP